MKAVILAGGLGSRLSEETVQVPKPMIEIGGRPMLWHIMSIYAASGINEFIVCLGYKGSVIKEYFLNYHHKAADVTVDLASGDVTRHGETPEDWRVTLVDTGQETQTGGRLKRIAHYVKDEEAFCMTYGDAVTDLDISKTVAFHAEGSRLATVTGVRPPGRFGSMKMRDHAVTEFEEKPSGDGAWINGGFFVLSPGVLDYIDGDASIWEHEPMEGLVRDGQLRAWQHDGFWHCMDTLRDKRDLERIWQSGDAPWLK